MAVTEYKTRYHHKDGNTGDLRKGCYKCGKLGGNIFLASLLFASPSSRTTPQGITASSPSAAATG
jgi:hypothetical protein